MRYLLVIFLTAAGCTGSSQLCAQVKCGAGKVCNPASGFCEAGDGGVTDAGSADSGTADAGMNDAGSAGDGGIACVPACSGTQKCDPASGRCVECLTNRDCACPAPACVNGSCLTPAPSDAGLVNAPPAAESCGAARPFTFLGCTLPRSFTFRVDLSGRSDDEQGVCSAAGGQGRDLVYVLSLEATYDLDVTVTPVGAGTAEPVVYVRRMPCSGQELACTDSGGPFTAGVHLRSRTAGDYAIFVDTIDAAGGGEVEVTLTLGTPTLPGNETCLSADPIATDGGAVRADLSLASNDEPTTCNRIGVDSPDLAWRFVLGAPSDIVARVAAVTPDAGVAPYLEVREGGCGMGTVRSCVEPSAAGVAAVRLRSAPAGVYTLVVENRDAISTAGLVDVSVLVQPPSPPLQHDTCAAPRNIVFADGGTFVELDVDTTTASDDENGTCNDPANFGRGGPEYIYHLQLLSPRHVTITASRGASGFADPVLYIRKDACPTATGIELGCSDDPVDSAAVETLTSEPNTLAPGDYYIFVESYGASVGPTHLTVSASP